MAPGPKPPGGWPKNLSSSLRAFTARLRDPLSWCEVDKALLVLLLSFLAMAAYFLRITYLLHHPEVESYYDREALATFGHILFAFLLFWMLLIVAGIGMRAKRPGSPLFVYSMSVSWWLLVAVSVYAVGPWTTPVSITFLLGGLLGLLLFGRKVTLAGILPCFVILAGTTLAERARMIPYAPLFGAPPIAGGQLAGEFVVGTMLAVLAASALALVLFSHIINGWRNRERALAEAYGLLKEAHEETKEVTAVQRQMAKALDTMQLGVTIADPSGKILYVNSSEAAMHGRSIQNLIGRNVTVFAPPNLVPLSHSADMRSYKSWRRESANIRSDGTIFPVQLISDVILDEKGSPAGIVTICEDITERRKTEQSLRDSEERYTLAIRGSNDAIWDVDLRKSRIFFSPRWNEMLGRGKGDDMKHPDEWFEQIHQEDRERVQRNLKVHLEGGTPHFEERYRIRCQDGKYRWILCSGAVVLGADGKPCRIAGSQTDITSGGAHDPLTGLPNRVLFMERLTRVSGAAAKRTGPAFAVLFLDLDQFKEVNDTLGHRGGDELLVEIGRRIEASVRPTDYVARLGGDEFTILLEQLDDLGICVKITGRILGAISRPVHLDGREVSVTASIGVVWALAHAGTSEEILHKADEAMYSAKRAGGGNYKFFNENENSIHPLNRDADIKETG